MAVIFLDESGQFTKREGNHYFVVASFTIGEPRRTAKQFRAWCRKKFPRVMRDQPEIKFSSADIGDQLRLKTIEFIAHLDVRVRYVYLRCQNIPQQFWKKDRLESGLLYTSIIGELLGMYLPVNEQEFRVFCDERHLKGFKRGQFKEHLKTRLLPNLPAGTLVQIEMTDSAHDANIQIADWIVGALAVKLEQRPQGTELFQALRNNIVQNGQQELFKEDWNTTYNKQKTQPSG